MPGSVIGTQMNLGFLGQFARNGDYVVRGDNQVKATDTVGPSFADALCINTDGSVSQAAQFVTNGGTPSMANFGGFAVREVKTMETFIQSGNSAPTVGGYAPGQACDALKRGCIIVKFQPAVSAVAARAGAVYLRISTNGTYPAAVVGGIESASDGGHTVQLTNCQFFTGLIDAVGQVEVELLTIANA